MNLVANKDGWHNEVVYKDNLDLRQTRDHLKENLYPIPAFLFQEQNLFRFRALQSVGAEYMKQKLKIQESF